MVPNLFRSAEYWHALMQSAHIFDKGVPAIMHDRPRSYYKCLLDLDAESLLELLRRPDIMLLKEADYVKVLRRLAVDIKADAIADEGLLPIEDAPSADLPLVAVGHMAPKVHHEVIFLGTTIHYDNWSQRSGERRAYIRCRSEAHKDHNGIQCTKYSQLNQFPTVKDLAAWLLAWRDGGEDLPDRFSHRKLGKQKKQQHASASATFPTASHPPISSPAASSPLLPPSFSDIPDATLTWSEACWVPQPPCGPSFVPRARG
eukprot:6597180-Pyramimonas_sp.AAC.1